MSNSKYSISDQGYLLSEKHNLGDADDDNGQDNHHQEDYRDDNYHDDNVNERT